MVGATALWWSQQIGVIGKRFLPVRRTQLHTHTRVGVSCSDSMRLVEDAVLLIVCVGWERGCPVHATRSTTDIQRWLWRCRARFAIIRYVLSACLEVPGQTVIDVPYRLTVLHRVRPSGARAPGSPAQLLFCWGWKWCPAPQVIVRGSHSKSFGSRDVCGARFRCGNPICGCVKIHVRSQCSRRHLPCSGSSKCMQWQIVPNMNTSGPQPATHSGILNGRYLLRALCQGAGKCRRLTTPLCTGHLPPYSALLSPLSAGSSSHGCTAGEKVNYFRRGCGALWQGVPR